MAEDEAGTVPGPRPATLMKPPEGGLGSPPPWVADWQVGVQMRRTPEEIEAERQKWLAATTPADLKTATVLLDETLELFHPLPPNWDKVAPFYVEAIEDLPLDLLQEALSHVRRTCVFFPKPAEIRSSVAEKLRERLDAVVRLETLRTLGAYRG